jgi:antirestriction protein
MPQTTNFSPRIFLGTPQAPACGKWLDLPMDSEELEAIRNEIAGDSDYIISDIEDLPGVGEFTSLDEANEYAEWLVDENPEPDLIAAFIDVGIELNEIPRKYKENDYFMVEGTTEQELGENYIDSLGGIEYAISQENLEFYFDYKKYGRELSMSDFGQYGDHWIQIT